MFTRKQLLRWGLLFLLVATFALHLFPHFSTAIAGSNRPTLKSIKDSLFKEWLAINLYKMNINKDYESEIINEDYFISPSGRTDPLAEFVGFENLIRDYLNGGDGKEELCRFPARMTLFENNYNWFNAKDRPICTDYIEQNKPDFITSVSLIHVSGYFDNPSSYYGHTLLKLNYEEDMPNQTFLDSSINYGADVTDNISSPLYVINGLFGGYKARYRRNNHFLHTHNYTNNQIRDVWEYELLLTKQQVKFISEYIWEINNARFTYYFLNDNCAHRVSKLLELALGINISKSHGFWLLPMQVVRNLSKESEKRTPRLIKREKYHPSLKRIFFDRYNLLSKKEKNKFAEFFSDGSYVKQKKSVTTLSTKNLLLILDYLDIQVADATSKSKDEKLVLKLQNKRSIVLGQLLKYQVKEIHKFPEGDYEHSSLLSSQPASVLRAGYGVRKKSEFASMSYRVANNDFLDSPDPKREISKFVMGKVEIEAYKNNVKLTNATLIDIVNFNTNPLPLKITKEYSWSMNVGYSQRSRVCSKCSTFGVESKWGTATRVNSRLMLYGLFGGRIHTKQGNRRGIITIAPELGGFIHISKKAILGFSATYHNDLVLGNSEYFLKADAGFNIARSFDIRATMESDGDDVVSMFSAGYYFD